MLGYEGLYEDRLKTDLAWAPVRKEDDLPDEIRGTAVWFFPNKLPNGHDIPLSYHVAYEAVLYPVEFINERWYWIDWDDGDKHTGYWAHDACIVVLVGKTHSGIWSIISGKPMSAH